MTRIISLLLCLFLCANQSCMLLENQDFLKQSQLVSIEQASALSEKIQNDINQCMKVENLGKRIKSLCLEEKKKANKSIASIKKKLNSLKAQKDSILKRSEWSEEELDLISTIEKLQKDLANHNKQVEKYDQILTKVQKELGSILIRHQFDQKAQDELEMRFMEEIVEMNGEGEYNVHKVIGGSENLPIYGGQKAYKKSSNFSCLVAGDFEIDTYSEDWIYPISGGTISAGTWSYPGGGMHLGMDYAVSLYTPVLAPANGLILYADNPVSSNCGYFGNMCGWPYGGGNTICMICAVNGSIYGVSFAHLSSEIYVYAGQQVAQGQTIALSGNSGNSTGPHCHIEIFTLSSSLDLIVDYFSSTADFAFGCGWDEPATCSGYGCRVRPETIL